LNRTQRLIRFSSKVVGITGASAGIGRACAERLSADGAAVVLGARRIDRLESIAADLRADGGRAHAVRADVTRPEDMHALVQAAVDTFGRLDVMICNAGIGYYGPLDDTPPDVMKRLVDVNVLGTMYAAYAALPVFRRQGSGHVIAMSSISGRRGFGGASVYSATKAAQVGLIEALRAEFVGTNLRASLIYPVTVSTELREVHLREYGRQVEGAGPRQSPESVASMVADCIAHPTAEMYPFRRARWLAILSVLAPQRMDRFVRRYHRRVVPVTPHERAHP
jgi:NADP-dependent 3-hydroxy acid dehydrogenase YdfG